MLVDKTLLLLNNLNLYTLLNKLLESVEASNMNDVVNMSISSESVNLMNELSSDPTISPEKRYP
jgi:hypothetical protein